MEDIQAIASAIESITFVGFLILSIRWLIDDAIKDREFMNDLRKEERSKREQRDQDIIDDWKRMRQLEAE